jgi:dolichol-phosphate mannosyltransferase
MVTGHSQTLLAVPLGSLQVPAIAHPPDPGTRAFSSIAHPIKFSLIIPTYNEGKNIRAIVDQLTSLLEPALPGQYELIVVDDDSPDRTWELALNLMPDYPQLRVMRRQEERGLSTAVIRGWQAAAGEVLGVIDGDLQHPPEVLLNLLGAIERADLAVASRNADGGGVSDWSPTRRFLSRGAQTLGLILLPQVVGRVSDPMSGYFLVRREAIANCTLNPLGYKILLEVLGRGDIAEVAEVGYVFQERKEGESKVTWRQYVDYLLHLARLRFSHTHRHIRQIKGNLPIARFVRFGLVGLSGVFVDMAMFYLLSDPTALGWGLTRSKIIASEVAIVNNFLWNDRWTFGDISQRQSGKRQRFRRFLKFNLVCLAGLILNVLLLNFLFNGLGINRYVANLIAIAVITIWNFWLNLKLSWRVTDTRK